MKRAKIRTTRTIKTCYKLELTATDIMPLIPEFKHGIPSNARISIVVPSGADWSGETVDIDHLMPLIIEWSNVESTEEGEA